MRLFHKGLRKSLSAAGARQRLGALLLAVILVGSDVPAGAAETYRGDDPDSYDCSSDYQILNRFSAPPGVSAARSTKYSDINFTIENNVISVKDASNSKDLAYVAVGEDTKYCIKKGVRTIQKSKEPDSDRPECNVRYYVFEMRIGPDSELPVRPFSLRAPVMFDRMELGLIQRAFSRCRPASPSTPGRRATHRAETARSAHVPTSASCRRVAGRARRHDAVR